MTMLESLPIIDVASLILAVFLGYLAVREYVDHRTGKLEKELTMVNSALTRERYAFSDRALQMYGIEGHQLLYRDGWVVPFRAGILMEDVHAVKSDAPVNVGDTRHPKWMPYRGLTYSDNVKMTLGKKISYLPIYELAEDPRTKGGSVTVPVRTCQYCQFFDTCDYLSFEIAHAMRIRRIPPEAIRMPDLPYRSSIEPYDRRARPLRAGRSTTLSRRDPTNPYAISTPRAPGTGPSTQHSGSSSRRSSTPGTTSSPLPIFSSTSARRSMRTYSTLASDWSR